MTEQGCTHIESTGNCTADHCPSHSQLLRCCADAMDDGRVFSLTTQHAQQRVEISEEGIQRCKPGANTLVILPLRLSNQLVVISPSVKLLDLKHLTHFSLMGSQLRRKYVEVAAKKYSYLRVLHTDPRIPAQIERPPRR